MRINTTVQGKAKATSRFNSARGAVLVAVFLAALFLAACEPEKSAEAARIPTLSVFYSWATPATTTPDPADEITSLAIVTGNKKQLFTQTSSATWASSDDTIVTVSGTGEITAVAAGAAVVTASAAGFQDARIPVTVVGRAAPDNMPPPITLKTEGDLRLIGCADGVDRLRAAYTLANDITLTKDWEPPRIFRGSLDGAGYSIKNLVINKPNDNDIGLFFANRGTITNIGIEIGAAGITGKDIVGAVAGTNLAPGTIHAVVSGPGSITANSTVGGVAGFNRGRVVSVVLVDVSASRNNVGGIAGSNTNSVLGYVTGKVIGSSLSVYVGGLVGDNDNSTSAIVGYHRGGSIMGNSNTAGGVGRLKSGSFSGYARSKVSSGSDSTTTGQVIGGIAGSANAYYSATESEVTGSASNSVGTSITIDVTKTGAEQTPDYFYGLTFGTAEGEWTFHQGKWPSINLPADTIFDPYRGALQPIDP